MWAKLEFKVYNVVEFYYDLEDYQVAIQLFENVLKDFLDIKNCVEIGYMIIWLFYLLVKNSFVEK